MMANERKANMIKKWRTRDGRQLAVVEMETTHIENALAMLRQKGYVSPKTVAFYVTCPLPQGDMAEYAFFQEQAAVFDAPVSKFIDLFEQELNERKEANHTTMADERKASVEC